MGVKEFKEGLSNSIKKITNGVLNVLGNNEEYYTNNDSEKNPWGPITLMVLIFLFIILSFMILYVHIMALVLSLRCNKGSTKWVHFILLLLFGYIFIFPLIYYIQMKDCKRAN